MSQGNIICCLCMEICEDSKYLYDADSGNPNEVYQLMMQYFDAKLLHRFTERGYKDMCLKCWQMISDFNSYQQSVYQTQAILLIKGEYIVSEVTNIELEDKFVPEDEFLSDDDCNKQSNNESRIHVKEEPAVSSSTDDCSEWGDNEEHDELDSGTNSQELPIKDSSFKEDVNKYFSAEIGPRKAKADKVLSIKASDDIIAQWKPLLDCTLCTRKFVTYTLLRLHFKTKHPQYRFQVECCEKMFFRRDKYEDHMRVHLDPRAFACSFCDIQHTCRGYLTTHLRKCHRSLIDGATNHTTNEGIPSPSKAKTTNNSVNVNSEYTVENKDWRKRYIKNTDDFIAEMMPVLECGLCSEKCSRYAQFRKHFSHKHPGNKCYITCCNRKITERYRVLEHLRHHDNPDIFKCKLCDLRFKFRQRLQEHMKILHNIPVKVNKNQEVEKRKSRDQSLKLKESNDLLAKWLPIRQCAMCEEPFSTLGRLVSHFMRSHPKEEFYVECCQRKFKIRRDIEAHVRYHLEPTDHICKTCLFCYGHKRSFVAHMRDAHRMFMSSKCDYCNSIFTNRRSILPHMRAVHPDIEYPTKLNEK